MVAFCAAKRMSKTGLLARNTQCLIFCFRRRCFFVQYICEILLENARNWGQATLVEDDLMGLNFVYLSVAASFTLVSQLV